MVTSGPQLRARSNWVTARGKASAAGAIQLDAPVGTFAGIAPARHGSLTASLLLLPWLLN
jgi:hypothetical protein